MIITNEAKALIEEILSEQEIEGIRLYFKGISCEIPNIGLSFEEAQENDELQVINGISVAIQEAILPYTKELLLDVHLTPYGPGLALVGAKDQ
ncbi:Fe-S cluster assembly protein HesB [Priestia flexa]|jgi:iron-sulfur cluster assembly protein|uniref:Fe-S cluster assembly protein HesB n=1 Tax=Priestia flexa TaxID=86664 RepID=A0A8I1SP15_9BACI|nr:Fe-S cluster assembly protein HesB [Priestia flexa]MBN8252348.1 Fe-S cluster assembly protein HesB [Priestia flexa]MBN8435857.1 Fe-S cluster assembly protein HesB [Priestia flexa]MCA0968414.1 Fe-S cluster assembly protein HesB [Priestia flexa]RIV10104.1 Fe-S cluster assembly protein HesB [Priestia flexa]UIR28470.1 Fe-S cluster assembly protein HesB [Priestia flexa]